MGARWYNPASGTFTSRDSVELPPFPSSNANRYTYALGDPLDYVDPTGNFAEQVCGYTTQVWDPDLNRYMPVPSSYDCFLEDPAHAPREEPPPPLPPPPPPPPPPTGSSGVNGHSGGGSIGGGGSSSNGPTAAERAAAARRAALERARAITRRAKQRAAFAAKHNPLGVLKAALVPLYAGSGKPPVSPIPNAPAKQVDTTRNVVADQAKGVAAILDKALADAGNPVSDVSNATRDVSEFGQSDIFQTPPNQDWSQWFRDGERVAPCLTDPELDQSLLTNEQGMPPVKPSCILQDLGQQILNVPTFLGPTLKVPVRSLFNFATTGGSGAGGGKGSAGGARWSSG
jgi:hypothetical protein